ncbi:hypothetical protein HaLaN_16650, partial [Haematococcus lacustris]
CAAGGQGGAGHKLDTQAEGGREGSDPTCRARGYWATSVAAVGRGEARMKNWHEFKCQDLSRHSTQHSAQYLMLQAAPHN